MCADNFDNSVPDAVDKVLNDHEYVDLGLPSGTLWATCNMGADSPYHSGRYFAWGETKSRDIFKWYDYEFLENEYTDDEGFLNYTATDIGDDIAGSEYDAAQCEWGDGWTMPTSENWEELQSCCRMEFSKVISSDVKGSINKDECLRICGPNGNSILLPLTFSPHDGVSTEVLRGEYWSSTACTGLTDYSYPSAIQVYYNPTNPKLESFPNGRHDGLSIRPVINGENIGSSVRAISKPTVALKYENGSISICGSADGCELKVSDISGRNIYSSYIIDNYCRLPHLKKGIYIATLSEKGKTISILKFSIK